MVQRWLAALRQRFGRGTNSGSTDQDQAEMSTPRDYQGERETARHAGMSAEDRAWETASRQREAASHPGGDNSPDSAPSREG